MSNSNDPTQKVTYSGGMDGVVMNFDSGHIVEFPRGVAVEVCGEDAKALADHPDFNKTASKAKANPTPTPTSKEDE
jgi:hypothetical protein